MSLRNEVLGDGRTMGDTILDSLCRTMPTTAVASGLVSAVDFSAALDRLSERFPVDARPDNLGLTALIGWLAERGEPLPVAVAKQLRLRWLKDALRAEAAKMGPISLRAVSTR